MRVPEVPPLSRNRWYQVRWPGDFDSSLAWAEKYFDDRNEAYSYSERRETEVSPRRVHMPVPSHEDPKIWAVCVEPA